MSETVRTYHEYRATPFGIYASDGEFRLDIAGRPRTPELDAAIVTFVEAARTLMDMLYPDVYDPTVLTITNTTQTTDQTSETLIPAGD